MEKRNYWTTRHPFTIFDDPVTDVCCTCLYQKGDDCLAFTLMKKEPEERKELIEAAKKANSCEEYKHHLCGKCKNSNTQLCELPPEPNGNCSDAESII